MGISVDWFALPLDFARFTVAVNWASLSPIPIRAAWGRGGFVRNFTHSAVTVFTPRFQHIFLPSHNSKTSIILAARKVTSYIYFNTQMSIKD